MKDLRSEICEALAEIPTLLASTHRALGAFHKSEKLHQCSATLYSATIAALRHIVEWYQEKALSKPSTQINWATALIDPPPRKVFQEPLQAKLIRTEIERFNPNHQNSLSTLR